MRKPKRLLQAALLLAFVLIGAGLGFAQEPVPTVNLDVREFRLPNGMLFLVLERPTAPQIACRVALRAGSALEEAGRTGIAHMLEHMLFKGTKNFGSRDFRRDLELQQRIEQAYQDVLREERRREPDRALIRRRLSEMEDLRIEVQQLYLPQAFASQLARNGAVGINAFTTKDETQYFMSIPSDMLEQWFSIVSEQLFEPAWREFYVEKEVVQREWAFRYVNNPQGAAWLDLHATAYAAHPYRNPTIGWKADMERFSSSDAQAFHRRYYHPANAVAVLVGDLKLEEARGLALRYFARYPAGEPAPETVTREPQQQGPRRSVRWLGGARSPLVRIGFHTAAMGTADFYALDALTMVLSQGRSGRLTERILNQGKAVEAWAHQPDQRYAGMFLLGGSPNDPAGIGERGGTAEERRRAYLAACEDLERLLLAELEELKSEPVTARDLARIQRLNQRAFLERMRSNEDLAGTLATLEVQAGWRYLLSYLEKMAEVGPEEIQAAARKYLREENRTSVFVIPGEEPGTPPEEYTEVRMAGGAAAPGGDQPPSLKNHSDYPTPPGWRHPLSFERRPEKVTYRQAERVSLEGVPLFYLPDRQLPFIDLAILARAGEVDLDETQAGLTDLLGDTMIRGGTESRAPAALALALDENAIQVSVSPGLEETAVRLSVLKQDWKRGLALLEEILSRPAFDPAVLAAAKEQALTDLARSGGAAHRVAMREGLIQHFKGHPYGRDPLDGLKTIPSLRAEDLRAFVQRFLVAPNLVLALAGDIALEEVKADLTGLLGALPRKPAPERSLADPAETPPVLAFIHKPGQLQSQVSLWLRGIPRSHPDFWKLGLLADLYGGQDSLLYNRLREDLGLVYAAGFQQSYRWQAGLLVGYLGCRGDQTAEAIEETLELMRGLRRGIPEDRLRRRKLDALNSFVFNVDTAADLVEVYARYRLRNEPLDTLDRIQAAYLEASGEELLGLARSILDPGKVQIVVVGDRNTQSAGAAGAPLDQALRSLAARLGLPYAEWPLR